MKKIISILIAGTILLSLFSVISVSAESDESTTPTENVIETVDSDEVISGDYIYIPLSETTAEIVEYHGSGPKVTIPSEIDGYKIAKIGYASFAFNNEITEVVIPEGVTEIDKYAFHMCQNLNNVEISDSVEIIGANAFRNCTKLADVKIGTEIKKIGSNAFGKSDIITISGYENTVAYIYATNYRINFISLGKAPEQPTEPTTEPEESTTEPTEPSEIISGDYIYIPLSETTAEIVAYNGSESQVTISSEIDGYQIVKIGYASFAFNNEITEVVIPEGITEIDKYAFHMCQNINSVVISDSVEIIGDNAFRNCSKLANVKIGIEIKKIGTNAFGKSDIITISGYENTVAYIYATNYRINFISLGRTPEQPAEPTTEPEEPTGSTTEATEPTTEATRPTTSATEPTESVKEPEVKAKKANKMTVTVKDKKVKAKKLKKEKVVVKVIAVKKANGKVTFAKVAKKSSEYLKVNTKTGKITVKKGTKKGAYKIKVKITAKGTKNYKSKTVTKTVKIKVT